MEAPLPPQVREGAPVQILAGYPGQMAIIFSGYIPTMDSVLDSGGRWATVTACGWANLLTDPSPETLKWRGPIPLKEIVRSIMALCKVPYSLVDDITYDNGSPILLGSNYHVNDGWIEIGNTTGLLGWLTQTLSLFGYAIFDTPEGVVRVQRLSGLPVGAPVMTLTEGQIGYRYGRTRTTEGMATYWRVTGARYTAQGGARDGEEFEVASIPETVPLTDALPGRGYRKAERSSQILDHDRMAIAVRNVLERDYGAPITPVTWQTDLAPHIQPGEIAEVTSPTVGADGFVWITGGSHSLPANGMKTTTFDGIRGNGSALPKGQDCISITLQDGPVHMGDEHIPWYAMPAPSGRVITMPFTVPNDYTFLKITALGHGCNSYLLGAENTEASVSRFVLKQNGEEISSGNLPVLAEDYERRLPYGRSDDYWGRIVVPMRGSLEPGRAVLEIHSGEDSRLPASTKWDDFEIKRVVLTACGVGKPEFVSGGVS